MIIGSLVWFFGVSWVTQSGFYPFLGRNGGVDFGLTLMIVRLADYDELGPGFSDCGLFLSSLGVLSTGDLRLSGGRFVGQLPSDMDPVFLASKNGERFWVCLVLVALWLAGGVGWLGGLVLRVVFFLAVGCLDGFGAAASESGCGPLSFTLFGWSSVLLGLVSVVCRSFGGLFQLGGLTFQGPSIGAVMGTARFQAALSWPL
ncbi:hypothetical protein U1Q18_001822 [Sarracenia purpurea var. burkii]